MKTLLTYVGLPGCGKTTDAMQRVNELRWCRFSRDDYRAMLHGGWRGSRDQEILVSRIRDVSIRTALRAGQSVVVDETNMRWVHVAKLKSIADTEGADFRVVSYLDTPLQTCIDRDSRRKASVGANVITNMWRNSLKNMIERWEGSIINILSEVADDAEIERMIDLAMDDPIGEASIAQIAVELTQSELRQYALT